MRRIVVPITILVALAAFIVFSSAYTVSETEQIIVTQFGKPVGVPIVEAGLHFKIPSIRETHTRVGRPPQ